MKTKKYRKPTWKEFWHSTMFKVLGGLFVLVLFGILYNLMTRKRQYAVDEEAQAAEQRRVSALDTLDVVGDYLFPNAPLQKDMEKETDKEEKDKDEKKSDQRESTAIESAEIMESADPSSDPTPEPTPSIKPVEIKKADAPTVETIEQ